MIDRVIDTLANVVGIVICLVGALFLTAIGRRSKR